MSDALVNRLIDLVRLYHGPKDLDALRVEFETVLASSSTAPRADAAYALNVALFRAREVMAALHHNGGLGLDVHENLAREIEAADRALQHPWSKAPPAPPPLGETAATRGPAEEAIAGTPGRTSVGHCPCGGELVKYTGARTPQAQCLKCKEWRWLPAPAPRQPSEPLGLCTCGATREQHVGPYGAEACEASRCVAFTPARQNASSESPARSLLRTLREVIHASPEVIAAAEHAVEQMEAARQPSDTDTARICGECEHFIPCPTLGGDRGKCKPLGTFKGHVYGHEAACDAPGIRLPSSSPSTTPETKP